MANVKTEEYAYGESVTCDAEDQEDAPGQLYRAGTDTVDGDADRSLVSLHVLRRWDVSAGRGAECTLEVNVSVEEGCPIERATRVLLIKFWPHESSRNYPFRHDPECGHRPAATSPLSIAPGAYTPLASIRCWHSRILQLFLLLETGFAVSAPKITSLLEYSSQLNTTRLPWLARRLPCSQHELHHVLYATP
jgi:hypothetical protein